MSEQKASKDAGTASHNHYRHRLPKWRYKLREALLPIVRAETPYVALLQKTLRCQFLDNYFALTANLGTHTFYMAFLPIQFWCGMPHLGRMMVTLLALGVYTSGYLKDLLCLPRPLSPPLTRISLSRSAALEYGFPSSHSTNAVSVAVLAILLLNTPENGLESRTTSLLQSMACFFAVSIVLGRLYCGMHGFFDVVLGSLLGAALAFLQFAVHDLRDAWLFSDSIIPWLTSTAVILALIRIHPEPVDDCPCFDDTVAFMSVIIGIDLGHWHLGRTGYADPKAAVAYAPVYDYQRIGLTRAVLRFIFGVAVMFAWRAVMKPALLSALPPVFRIVENYGLDLPRRFFLPASSYNTIPRKVDDNDLIPWPNDIPNLLRRRRAISIGPQSEADAYEAMAYRQKRRRDSLTKDRALISNDTVDVMNLPYQNNHLSVSSTSTSVRNRRRSLSLEEFRSQMGQLSPEALPNDDKVHLGLDRSSDEERDRKELFANVQHPRVRYDVEVVTKLIVYTGIAWIAVEGAPILFHHVGLD